MEPLFIRSWLKEVIKHRTVIEVAEDGITIQVTPTNQLICDPIIKPTLDLLANDLVSNLLCIRPSLNKGIGTIQ